MYEHITQSKILAQVTSHILIYSDVDIDSKLENYEQFNDSQNFHI